MPEDSPKKAHIQVLVSFRATRLPLSYLTHCLLLLWLLGCHRQFAPWYCVTFSRKWVVVMQRVAFSCWKSGTQGGILSFPCTIFRHPLPFEDQSSWVSRNSVSHSLAHTHSHTCTHIFDRNSRPCSCSLALFSVTIGKAHEDYAFAVELLARCWRNRGELEKCRILLNEALQVRHQVFVDQGAPVEDVGWFGVLLCRWSSPVLVGLFVSGF